MHTYVYNKYIIKNVSKSKSIVSFLNIRGDTTISSPGVYI